jgi:ribose transport system ATP-binding protein
MATGKRLVSPNGSPPITSDLGEMVTLAGRIMVMRGFPVCGEVVNDHTYEPMSREVMGLIHADV